MEEKCCKDGFDDTSITGSSSHDEKPKVISIGVKKSEVFLNGRIICLFEYFSFSILSVADAYSVDATIVFYSIGTVLSQAYDIYRYCGGAVVYQVGYAGMTLVIHGVLVDLST